MTFWNLWKDSDPFNLINVDTLKNLYDGVVQGIYNF